MFTADGTDTQSLEENEAFGLTLETLRKRAIAKGPLTKNELREMQVKIKAIAARNDKIGKEMKKKTFKMHRPQSNKSETQAIANMCLHFTSFLSY